MFGGYFALETADLKRPSELAGVVRPRVLLIHGLEPGSRQTTIDYVAGFLECPRGVDLTVANIFGFMPEWLGSAEFDLAVVTAEALSHRTTPFWPALERRIAAAMQSTKRRVIMPQDDYTHSALLDSLVIRAGIHSIYSPLISGLDLIYPRATKRGVDFVEALTGYFEPAKVAERQARSIPFRDRPIDIGQRVRKLPPQFGEIGIRKFEIAERVSEEARKRGLVVDFSPRPEDVMLGEAWFDFLGQTKFTVSCRGGSSIVDRHARIFYGLMNLKKIFPDMDDERAFAISSWPKVITGSFDAVSPRLFDAAMMGVCQILLVDDYMGMVPWEHYIPLERDYSNLDEVFEAMQTPGLAEKIAQNSADFLLDVRRFSYASIVNQMLEKEVGSAEASSSEKTTIYDVDAALLNRSELSDESTPETRIFEIARALAGRGYRKTPTKASLRNSPGVGETIGDLCASDVEAVDRLLRYFFKRPRFPELLIVPWKPLSSFLETTDLVSESGMYVRN